MLSAVVTRLLFIGLACGTRAMPDASTALAIRVDLPACTWTPTATNPGICTANIPTMYTAVPVTPTTTTVSTIDPAVGCWYQGLDPDAGINKPYCICSSKGITETAPLLSLTGDVPVTSSCSYTTWPSATISPTVDLPPAFTNTRACQICSQTILWGGECSPLANCVPEIPVATITVGSAPVHVGTLTGNALYTSVSNALEELCPPVTQTTAPTTCSPTGEASIPGIEYVNSDHRLNEGSLVLKVPTSGYNMTSLRDGLIQSIALSMQTSATGSNCFTVNYTDTVANVPRRRWLTAAADNLLPSAISRSLLPPRSPPPTDEPAQKTMCNAAYFHTADYYSMYWREAAQPGPTDFIDALVEFHTSNSDAFFCEFLDMLVDGIALLAPEFIVEDIELEEGIDALCCVADGTCQLDPGKVLG